MSVVNISLQQLLIQALKRAGVATAGQPVSGEDISDAQLEFHLMMAEWSTSRFNAPCLIERSFVSTGLGSYTIGPGGTIDCQERPARIYSCFVRLLINPGTPSGAGNLGDTNSSDFNNDFSQAGDSSTLAIPPGNPTDYKLDIVTGKEQWDKIANKYVVSLPSHCFYDGFWPRGNLQFWPIPNATIYELHVSYADYLDKTTSLTSNLSMPSVFYAAVIWNLALRFNSVWQMPEDMQLIRGAGRSLRALKRANNHMPDLNMPPSLVRPGVYNPYSDQVR